MNTYICQSCKNLVMIMDQPQHVDSNCREAIIPAFDATDPATWIDGNLPEGYEWREFDVEIGEDHLYAPDGTDLTEQWWNQYR